MARFGLISLLASLVATAGSLLVVLPQASATSSVVYVAAGGNDSGSCTSSTAPCASLTYGLSQVSSDGTVYVSGTIDVWDSSADPGDENGVAVDKNVTIEQYSSGPTAALEGSGASSVAGAIMTIGGAYTVVLDGLTFEDGNSSAAGTGGAITNDHGGNLTVDDCTLIDNEATNGQGGGGAIANADGGTGTLSIDDSTVSDNYAKGNGGALDNGDWSGTGTASVENSTFNGNHTASYGGAVDNGNDSGTGTLSVEDSTFNNNEAPADAGGAIATGVASHGVGTATVEDSTFSGNQAAVGGAIVEAFSQGAHGTLTAVADTFGINVGAQGPSEISSGANLGGANVSATVYTAADVFDGTCAGSSGDTYSSWTDGGYDASTDASCLGSTPAATDASVSSEIGSDLGPLTNNGGSTDTMLMLFDNPALGLIPAEPTSVTLGTDSYQLCPTTDQRGVASAGACNPGSVQDTPTGQTGSSTVYVAAIGSDSANDCAVAASPCASLTHALNEVAVDGTVDVSGTIDVWNSSANPSDDNGVAVDENVTIAQEVGGATAVLKGSGASSVAGAIMTIGGAYTVILDGLTFEDGDSNAANTGGAITNTSGGALSATQCDFIDNHSSDGGAIDNGDNAADGTVTVDDSTFEANIASTNGGAIDNADNNGSGTVTIEDSTFADNSASSDGGAIDNGDDLGVGHLTVEDSTFSANQALNRDGGAIDNGDDLGTGRAVIEDSTFDGNEAVDGGAIANVTYSGGVGTLTVVADTLADDVASGEGNEVGNGVHDSDGKIYAAGNLFDGSCVNDNDAGWTDGGYNASTSSTCLASSPPSSDVTSPEVGSDLGQLANNGGDTETMVMLAGNPALGLIADTPTSVTLNSVEYQLCSTTDQRGVATLGGVACNPGSVQDAPVVVTVYGSQTSGSSSPSFTYTTSPSGITVTSLDCTGVGTGTPIDASLDVGSYTILGSSCSGTAGPAYAITFTGAESGFTVSAASSPTPPVSSPTAPGSSPTPPVSSPAPPSSPPTRPVVTLPTPTSAASPAAGTVTVTISCQQTACIGTINLSVARKTKDGIEHRVLADARFSAKASDKIVVVLHATKDGEKIFPRSDGRRRWRTTGTIILQGGSTIRRPVYVEWQRKRR